MKFKKIFFLGLCLNVFNASLSGAASTPVPKISATPASANLGTVVLGASSTLNVITVKNTGTSDLIINSVTITGTDGDEFSETNNCGTIQPAASCGVSVTFTPNLPYAKKTAILAIASNDLKKPLLNVKLSGQLPPPAISATPASLNFGKLPAGTANSTKPVIVKNNGLSDLQIKSIGISGTNPGDFTATGNCGAIRKDGSCTVNILFEPMVPNVTRSASLDIASNDPRKSTVRLKLAGSSIAAKLPPAAPAGVTGTPGNGQATIAWTAVAGATSYNIYWSTTPGVTKTTGTKISGITSPYTHSGLTNGTAYYYVVTAVNTNGESTESTQITVSPVKPLPSISSLSTISAAPMSQLTITGAGFDPAAVLRISFFDNNGFTLDVPVLVADSTSIIVAVPPYSSPSTGTFGQGTVNVQVIQGSGASSVTSNTVAGFHIGPLPTLTLTPGSVTANVAGFLELALTDSENRLSGLDALSGGHINTVDLRTQLENIRIQYGQLKSKIRNSIANPGEAETIGEINGVPISLNQESRVVADQIMVAAINGIITKIQGTPALTASQQGSIPNATDSNCDPGMVPEYCATYVLSSLAGSNSGEQVSSQGYLKLVVPSGRDVLADLMKWFGVTAATSGAVVASAGVSIPVGAVVAVTGATITGNAALYGMDAAWLSANSSDKETAKRLLDDFNSNLQFMRDAVISPTIGALSQKAGIIYDLYSGWMPVLEDKIPAFLSQAKTFIDAGPPPTCIYAISPKSQSLASSGGTGSVTVTASSGCAWTTSSNADWITVSAGSSGSGAVSYTVTPNTNTSQRIGTIAVAGQTFTVTQAGASNVTGTWDGTLTMPGASYPGCVAQTVSFSLSLNEDAGRNITGYTSNSRTISSGTRNGSAITVSLSTMYGSRGPYTWSWNGADTITGSMAYFCYDLATGALLSEGTETFTVSR